VHCHGGQEVVAYLMEVMAAKGAVACSWQELDRRTSEDPLQCLAREALGQAQTVRTAQILLDQLRGTLARSLRSIIALLEQENVAGATAQLQELARRAALGRHLVDPWKVVVAGPPNVGKSSLVNALAGYNRCLVSPLAGTTRDVVSITLAIDGWPVELLDTAGWRDARGLEREGIERARQVAAEADLCLWLVDGSSELVRPGARAARRREVITKVDLPPAWNWEALPGAIPVSALAGHGLDELCQTVSQELVPDPPPAGAAVPFTPGLCDQIEQAWHMTHHGQAQAALNVLRKAGCN
jgi:tRNA modification GTPase